MSRQGCRHPEAFPLERAKTKSRLFCEEDGLGRDPGILERLGLACLLSTLPRSIRDTLLNADRGPRDIDGQEAPSTVDHREN